LRWTHLPLLPQGAHHVRSALKCDHQSPQATRTRSGRLVARDSSNVDVYGRTRSEHVADGDSDSEGEEAVVKVYTVHSGQDPSSPWVNKMQEESSGSGFAIEHNGLKCILTNAHVVSDAAYVEVRQAGDARKIMATRIKVAHQCDLALLHVADEAFWQGIQPLVFGHMPSLQDEVSVVGYPEGGEGIAITQGVVSRIEVTEYAHSGAALLAVQIDAAINPGNSGGPVFDDNKNVIGVAFQNQATSQNIGYIIPVTIIQHFLDDVDPEDPSRCCGFCGLGIFWQELENPQLRSYLNLSADCTGVLIRGILPLAPAFELLRSGDIITSVDGHSIANDATFSVGYQERLSLQHLIHLKFPGEKVAVSLLRDGKELELLVPVKPLERLVPGTIYDDPQPYFIYGGLAFMPLSSTYLHEWGDDWRSHAPHELIELALAGLPTKSGERPVILCRSFPAERTAGYSVHVDRRIVAVNGQPVLNIYQMYDLVQKLHASRSHIVFELQYVGCNALIVAETSTAEAVTKEVLNTYRIPAAASSDLLERKQT